MTTRKALTLAVLLAASAAWGQSNNVNLMWSASPSYRGNGREWYLIYHSTNVATPTTNWGLITTIPASATNVVLGVTNIVPVTNTPLFIVPGEHYFFLTFSNFWTNSVPSVPAGTPPLPVPGVIDIGRLP